MIRYCLFFTGLVGICYFVIASETAELHLPVLSRFHLCLRLPRMIDQVIQGIVREFRTHIPEEETRYRGFARCSAVIDHIPLRDTHHVLAAEPKAVEVLCDHRLNLLPLQV